MLPAVTPPSVPLFALSVPFVCCRWQQGVGPLRDGLGDSFRPVTPRRSGAQASRHVNPAARGVRRLPKTFVYRAAAVPKPRNADDQPRLWETGAAARPPACVASLEPDQHVFRLGVVVLDL